MRICEWSCNFKSVGINEYDGKIDPTQYIRMYSTTIQSIGGDSYVMANYLQICLESTGQFLLNTLL